MYEKTNSELSAAKRPSRVKVKGERGIYTRDTKAGKRYEFIYQDSTGRTRWQTCSTLKEARQGRASKVAALARGERVAPSRVTLGEYAAEWLAQQDGRLRPKTLDRYSTDLRLHVLPNLGRRKLASVTVDDVATLLADLQRNGYTRKGADGKPVRIAYAAWTLRGVLTVLGRLLGSAARRGLIPANPVAQLERNERPKVARTEFPSLDREAVGRLIGATSKRYRALVAVSVLLGLRQGEALGLRWQDVDTAAGVLRVRRQLSRSGELVEPKTQAAKRDVPMPPSLAKMLAAHRLASPHSGDADFVFASSAGTPLAVRNIIRRGLEPALAAAGLPRLRWHDLRHVAASALIEAGASPSYVARVLGHTSPAITLSIYAHVFAKTEHDERFREQQEQAFGDVLRGEAGSAVPR